MEKEQYELIYGDGAPKQQNIQDSGAPSVGAAQVGASNHKRFRLGEAGRSTLLIIAGVSAVLISERILPEGWRLTDFFGITDARFEAYHVSVEKEAQVQVDAYVQSLQGINQQNSQRVQSLLEAQVKNYDAQYQQRNILLQETARLQGALVQSRLELTRSTQSTDVAVINLSRLWGRVRNGIDGSGQPALDYANNLRNDLYRELDNATDAGKTVSIEGWDTDLPTPDQVREEFEQFQLVPLPPAPKIGISPPRHVTGATK